MCVYNISGSYNLKYFVAFNFKVSVASLQLPNCCLEVHYFGQ